MLRRIEVPVRVVKWLYAASGNQCAFAGCRQRLVEPTPDVDDVVVASDVAHIVAAREGGPRGQSELSAEERSRPANLIVLCQKHHRLVDQDRDRYSPDVLRGMKHRHAERVRAWNVPERGLPRSMPRPVHGFVGRDAELKAALSVLTRPFGPGDATPRAIVVTGAPGIGKTALAVQIAYMVGDAFPDGQVFLSAKGGCEHTVEGLIDDLTAAVGGGPLDASVSSRQRVAHLQEALAGRSLLVVVDDVPREDVLRGLLSISESVALVCTSRSRLSGTADLGVHFIELSQLPTDDAASLATTIAGVSRLTDVEAEALAVACGGHPLAIRIAASRLATRRQLDITTYLRRISDPDTGLTALFAGERTVIEVIEDSYQALEDDHAALLRILGQLPNVSLPIDVIAAAWADNAGAIAPGDVDAVERMLDSLFELNLIEQPEQDSYRLHDLLHKFARGKNGAPVNSTTVRSACVAFIARLHAVNQQICPSSDKTRASGAPAAMAQLERDRSSCIALLEAAKDAKLWDAVAAFSSALAPVLILGGFWRDIHRVSLCLAVAGDRTGNKEWLATAMHNLGLAAEHLGDAESATKFYRDSEAVALSNENLVMVQAARESYGRLLFNLGHYTDALPYFKDCLRVWRALHRDTGLAQTLSTLGHLYVIVGDWRRAERYLTNGRQVAERTGAIGLYPDFALGLSCLYRQTGRVQRAHDECRAALDSARKVADRYREALALLELGVVRQMREIPDSAAEPLQAALEIFRSMEDKVGEVKALHMLATCRRAAGDNVTAAGLLDRCYELALRLGVVTEAALCLADQATLLGDIGRMTDALKTVHLAEDVAADTGSRAVLARIRHCHALLLVTTGKYEAAIAILKTTGSLLRQTGQSDLRASAQICMADALMNDGRPLAAAALLDPIVNAPAESIGDGTRATAHRVLATLCSRRHLWTEGEKSIHRALALSRFCCDQEEEMHSLGALGNLMTRSGRLPQAITAYEQAADIAKGRGDFRFLLVIRANRLACLSRSDPQATTPPATNELLAEWDQVLRLAHQLGLIEVELGLSLNRGSWLANTGRVDEAIEVFQKTRTLAVSVSNTGHLATAELNLARALLTKSERAQGQSLAHNARELFESRHDWINAAQALGVQIHATATEEALNSAGSVKELVDPAWSVRRETFAALRSALEAESSPDEPDPAPDRRGRSIVVADDVRNLLTDTGVDINSVVDLYAESRHVCVACGLPIADDSAAELIAQPPDNDLLTTRLAHESCVPSAVVPYRSPTRTPQCVSFEIECALLGGRSAPLPAIIVDCYGGWVVGPDGKMVDVVLTALKKIGFEHVTSNLAINGDTTVTVPDELGPLSARLIGNRLTLRGGDIDSFFHDAELQFYPVWYQAAQQGVLTVMFGRNLLGMSWEDPSCISRAAQSGRLVATVAKLIHTPPGRNAVCICTPRTGLKYKKCCGRPRTN